MRTSTSNMPLSWPIRLAIGCCTRRKRFSINADLMYLTQILSFACMLVSVVVAFSTTYI